MLSALTSSLASSLVAIETAPHQRQCGLGFGYIDRRGGAGLHVEVKGLVGSLPPGAAHHQREAPRRVSGSTPPSPSSRTAGWSGRATRCRLPGGDLRHIEPWRIDEGDLEPVRFRWSPRLAGPAT